MAKWMNPQAALAASNIVRAGLVEGVYDSPTTRAAVEAALADVPADDLALHLGGLVGALLTAVAQQQTHEERDPLWWLDQLGP